ncbi:MAG: shikimate dehydrogenase family protein, partial [Acidimicrobiales bacterium]
MTTRIDPDRPSAGSPVVGVIGYPVAHSLSPLLHHAAFGALGLDWVSVGFAVEPGQLEEALAGVRGLGLRGVSVTMPHKGRAAELVDRLSGPAATLGAVNCITRDAGELVGHNTDGEGFLASLRRGVGFDPAGRRCVVFGARGA